MVIPWVSSFLNKRLSLGMREKKLHLNIISGKGKGRKKVGRGEIA